MNFKRVRMILLCAAVALLCLSTAGCKSDPYGLSRDNPEYVTIWHYYNGAQKQMFDEMVIEFNETVGAEKGIVVEAFSQGTVDELSQKVVDAANQKVGADAIPDVFAAYADTAYEIHRMGLAANLSAYLTKEELAAYVPDYLTEGQFDGDGSLMLMPIAKSTEVFMLNKTDWDAFAQETGASEDSFATWEGVREVAKAYYEWTDAKTEAPDDGKAFFGRDAFANYPIIGSVQLGQELFAVENGQVTLNVDREVFRRLWDNYYVPYINGYYAAIGRFRSDDAKTGDIIALVGSTTGATYFPKEVTNADGTTYQIETGVYPVPNFADAPKYAVQQGAGMGVTKSTPRREYAAVTFLKWFTQPEQNVRFSIGSGYLPVQSAANAVEAVDKAAAEGGQKVSPLMLETLHVGIDIVNTSKLYTTKAFEHGTDARAVVNNAMQNKADADLQAIRDLMAGGMPRAEAVAQYDTDANFDAWLTSFEEELKAAIA